MHDNDVLVIIVNAFSGRVSEGYLADRETMRKVGGTLTPRAIGEALAGNPDIRVHFSKA